MKTMVVTLRRVGLGLTAASSAPLAVTGGTLTLTPYRDARSHR